MKPQAYGPGKRATDKASHFAILVRRAGGYAWNISVNAGGTWPVGLNGAHELEFDQWHSPTPDVPLKKLAEMLLAHARHVGATSEALDILKTFIPISETEYTTMTEKAAAKGVAGFGGKVPEAGKPAAEAKAKTAALKATATETKTKKSGAPVPVETAKTKAAPVAKEKAAPKEKALKAAPVAKEKAEPKTRPPSASSRFKELVMAGGKTDDEIFAVVQKEFKLDDSKRSYVAWYRNFLVKAGEKPPAAIVREVGDKMAPKAGKGAKSKAA